MQLKSVVFYSTGSLQVLHCYPDQRCFCPRTIDHFCIRCKFFKTLSFMWQFCICKNIFMSARILLHLPWKPMQVFYTELGVFCCKSNILVYYFMPKSDAYVQINNSHKHVKVSICFRNACFSMPFTTSHFEFYGLVCCYPKWMYWLPGQNKLIAFYIPQTRLFYSMYACLVWSI